MAETVHADIGAVPTSKAVAFSLPSRLTVGRRRTNGLLPQDPPDPPQIRTDATEKTNPANSAGGRTTVQLLVLTSNTHSACLAPPSSPSTAPVTTTFSPPPTHTALACKAWLRTISDPAFLHRYRAFHGAPPLLGLVDREPLKDPVPRFVATTAVPAFSFLTPAADTTSATWPAFSACALDCRHGRALIRKIENGRQHYLVCDPVTGDHHRVPRPGAGTQWMVYDSFAVFCGVTGCQHLDCHGGPFYVLFMFRNWLARPTMSATIYSSETGAWSVRATLEGIPALEGISDTKAYGRGALIGDEIYFMLSGDAGIVKYDWGKNSLSVVNRPASAAYSGGVTLMVMEDCSLGLAGIEHTHIYLWSRRVSSNSDMNAEWVQCRVIDLENMMPIANPRDRAQVVGFAEGVGVIFITTGVGLFMMELKSGKVKKIGKPRRNIIILPYMSFYTPDRCSLPGANAPSMRARLS